ncbi:MAG: methyltransferase domain-containing protein [Acidobacteriota bacterium]
MYPESLGITMASAKGTTTSRKQAGVSQVFSSDPGAVNEWWKTFFDREYLKIWRPMFTEDVNAKQAADLWSMLDLEPGCRLLDAPCGWGRLSRRLALLGADVLGVDQSEVLLATAESERGELRPERLRYVKHDLRLPLRETGFDVACNIFTSFGYGTEDEDAAIFRTLRDAIRPGGRVVVETNHRDLMCAFVARGSKASKRMPDGTLFVDEPEFDAISGVVRLNWYWSGPSGSGEKHAEWRCYTPTQIVGLLERAGLRFAGAYQGLSKNHYKAEGPEVGGRLAVIAMRDN